MRRRALLAVSTISSGSDNPWGDLPAESTTFEFPLYINITKKNPDYPDEWLREADDLLEQLFDWLVENATIDKGYEHYEVPAELLASNNIYINGGLVEKAMYYSGSIELSGETIPFEEVFIDIVYMYGYGAKLPQGGGGNDIVFPLTIQYGTQTKELFDYLYDYIEVNGEEYLPPYKLVAVNSGDITVVKDNKNYTITQISQCTGKGNELYSIRLVVSSFITYFDIMVDTYEMKFFDD